MTITATLIVLLSALAHAGWNLFGKSVSPSGAFFWYCTLWGAVITLPVLVFYQSALTEFTPAIWWMVLLTGFFQATYLSSLAAAYRYGEMSIVYPLARSSPLIILLIGAVFLGTVDRISLAAVAGILLIVAGCMVLPMRHLKEFSWSNYLNLATLFALMAAASTAGYSLVDDAATRWIRALPGHGLSQGETALLFVVLQAWSTLVWLSVIIALQARERQLMPVLAANWRSTLAAGVLILGTYGLVVWAMAYADDVSYVVAFRQISIPIGVAMSWFFLKETLHGPKILGVVIVLIGLTLVVLG
ncbi:EamA family transporter [Marinobacter sp. HN1S83]|uniref:EamA family transporter n=1 Tax=Marinobacter sp. HN1S83 TaxID=3382301 RepID=UPI00387B2AF4